MSIRPQLTAAIGILFLILMTDFAQGQRRNIVPSRHFSQDGKRFAQAGIEGSTSVEVFHVATKKCLLQRSYDRNIHGLLVELHPEGAFVSVVYHYGRSFFAEIIEIETGTIIFSTNSGRVKFTPDGVWIAIDSEESVRFLKLGTGKISSEFCLKLSGIQRSFFSSDGKHCFVIQGDRDYLIEKIDMEQIHCSLSSHSTPARTTITNLNSRPEIEHYNSEQQLLCIREQIQSNNGHSLLKIYRLESNGLSAHKENSIGLANIDRHRKSGGYATINGELCLLTIRSERQKHDKDTELPGNPPTHVLMKRVLTNEMPTSELASFTSTGEEDESFPSASVSSNMDGSRALVSFYSDRYQRDSMHGSRTLLIDVGSGKVLKRIEGGARFDESGKMVISGRGTAFYLYNAKTGGLKAEFLAPPSYGREVE